MARTGTRGIWQRRVARWARSGLSRGEFAAREGVRPETLGWWRWFLRSAHGGEARAALTTRELSFVEVEPIVIDDGRAARIEIALGNGRVVRVPSAFDDAVLSRVLAVAERR